MELLNTKIVKVGDMEFPIKISVRAMIEYEQLTGKSITNFNGTSDLIQFFYVTAKAGNKEFKHTYEEFLDLIDDYYTETITNFSRVLSEPGGEGKKQIKK